MARPTPEQIAAMSDEERMLAATAAMANLITRLLDEEFRQGKLHPDFRMADDAHRSLLAAQLAPLVLQLAQDIAQGLVSATVESFGEALNMSLAEKEG